MERAPSFNAGTNSLRKEKGVCGKNLCGVFLRDFHQPAAAFPLCRWQRGNAKKRDRQCLSLFLDKGGKIDLPDRCSILFLRPRQTRQ